MKVGRCFNGQTCQVYQRICDDLVIMRPLLSCTDAETEILMSLEMDSSEQDILAAHLSLLQQFH